LSALIKYRPFLAVRLLLLLVVLVASSAFARDFDVRHFDVVVYGGSPAGVMAAVAAARAGARTVVIEPTRWIGGMVAGGLSSSDVGNTATIGGLALEFFDRCGQHYPGQEKWYGEPHVYQEVFAEML
jgi:ribulose 1,5-bisphosphate synthetase/thiazole synthase